MVAEALPDQIFSLRVEGGRLILWRKRPLLRKLVFASTVAERVLQRTPKGVSLSIVYDATDKIRLVGSLDPHPPLSFGTSLTHKASSSTIEALALTAVQVTERGWSRSVVCCGNKRV